MKVRIARIAKRMHNKFRGLYWRQMFVTVGMVLLTLFLLGVSFFSLSYNYARGQENGELAAQAQVVGQLSASYLENGRYLDMEELQHEEDFQRLASFAATVSSMAATGRPSSARRAFRASRRPLCSAWLPWEKLNRATFMPASSICRRTPSLSVAGPRVHTIFVFLINKNPPFGQKGYTL